MKNRLLKFLKHAAITITGLLAAAIIIGLNIGARLHYSDHPDRMKMHGEGPYIFYQTDSTLIVNHVQGNKKAGFYHTQSEHSINDLPIVRCNNPLDSSYFDFQLNAYPKVSNSTYNDNQPIFAVSDIEGNYLAFRDFLITNKVIDHDLNWAFGQGHLVLVGDFVDRGYFVTQVLWLIYKLEQEAELVGGKVHFIIGNHELKNLHGNYESASKKYLYVSSILGKSQSELYGPNSFLGRWLATKNAIEKINGHLFVHGGLHPEIQDYELNIIELNDIIRANYRTLYFPKPNIGVEKLINSHRTGPCWYRGYFKDSDLTELQVAEGLSQFGAKDVIVGHTIQSKANRSFGGMVIGIDVQHPSDDRSNWPEGRSEGLFIEGDNYFRVFDDGSRESI